mgnify:CR=1 FL=1
MTQQINTTRGTSSPQKKDYQTIFVYGSLRKGMGLNPVLTSSEYLGTVTTEPKYTMYDLGAFPCITEQGETSLVGDLYIVNSDVLSQLDVIESVPNLYDRKEISIQDYDNVQAYFWASNEVQMIDEYTIHGGDWLFHRGLIKDVEVEVYYDEDKVVGRSVDLIRETEVEDE